jgi:hypothetical protein
MSLHYMIIHAALAAFIALAVFLVILALKKQ